MVKWDQVAVEPGAVACFFLLNLTRQSHKRVASGKAISKNPGHKDAISWGYVINYSCHQYAQAELS